MSKMKGHFPLEDGKRVAEKAQKLIGSKTFVCGSIRRGVESIGDVDIVVVETKNLVSRLRKNGFAVKNSMATAEIDGIPVAVYFCNEENVGSMIMHFTGSKELNIMMRGTARKKGMMLNQYGLFRGSECIASHTEKEIYDALGMRFLKPEERKKSF